MSQRAATNPSDRHVFNALAMLRQEAARLAEPFDDSHGTHFLRGRRRAWCDGVRTAREVTLEKIESAIDELEWWIADELTAEGEAHG